MSDNTNDKKDEKEKISAIKDLNVKFSIITPVIILIIVLLFIGYLSVNTILSKNKNFADVKLFEKAYVKILDFDKAEFNEKELQSEEILKILDILISKYPKSKPAERAVFYKGYIYFHTEKYDKALELFNDFIKNHKKSHLLDKAYYFLSFTYSEKKEYDKAIETLKIFEDGLNNSYFAPLALLHLGYVYEQKNDKDNAVKTYQKIIDKYNKSAQVDLAKKKIQILKYDIKLTNEDYNKLFPEKTNK